MRLAPSFLKRLDLLSSSLRKREKKKIKRRSLMKSLAQRSLQRLRLINKKRMTLSWTSRYLQVVITSALVKNPLFASAELSWEKTRSSFWMRLQPTSTLWLKRRFKLWLRSHSKIAPWSLLLTDFRPLLIVTKYLYSTKVEQLNMTLQQNYKRIQTVISPNSWMKSETKNKRRKKKKNRKRKQKKKIKKTVKTETW